MRGTAALTLGVLTAAISPKTAMAFTIAMEEKISKENQKQCDILFEDVGDLHAIVERFRDKELAHRDIAVYHDAGGVSRYKLLRTVTQSGCRVAIKITERV